MNYLQVKDWHEHQTYRTDRGTPPWIKIHRNLMTNPKWAELTDAEKGQLVSMWVAAADKNGLIPENPIVLRKICMLDDAPNTNRFIELGFLTPTCQPNDAKVTPHRVVKVAPHRQPVDAPETETETDNKRQSKNTTSNAALFDAWWQAYPKKVEKKKAKAIWKRRKLDTIADTIIVDTTSRNQHCEKWKQGYIPNPTTYLNGDRWEDEYETKDMKKESKKMPKSDHDVIALGNNLGVVAHPGEAMWDYRSRVEQAL